MPNAVQLTKNNQEIYPVTHESLVVGLNKRAYDSQSPNGMGYLVLEKDKTFASQVTETNTIYEIRYDFNLGGGDFNLPAGCVLRFDGGKISDGAIIGNGSLVDGDTKFDSVTFSGTFDNEEISIDSNHFIGIVDFFGICKSFSKAKIILGMDIVVTAKDNSRIPSLNLDAKGHSIKVKCLSVADGGAMIIKNANFDCSIAESSLLYVNGTEGGFLDLYGDGTNNIEISNCKFNYIPGGFTFTYFRNVAKVDVSGCVFDGVVDPESVSDLGGRVIFLYGISESAIVDSCKITNCHGIAIGGINNSSESAVFVIRNNYIVNITRGGVVFNGGTIQNVFVDGNVINDVNLAEHSTGAQYSAINFHGFKNIRITKNTINATGATGLDIDGSLSTSTDIAHGENAEICGNELVCRSCILWVVKDTNIHHNLFDLTEGVTLSGQIKFANNVVKAVSANSIYAITPSKTAGYTFDLDIAIYDNEVYLKSESTSGVWIFCNSALSGAGVVNIRGTKALRSTGAMAMYSDAPKILSFEDGTDIIVKRINLSVASKEILIPRFRPGALMGVESCSVDGQFTLSASVNLSFGLARPSAAPNDTQFGTITLSGQYNGASKSHLFTSRPNNTEQASTGDVYMVCPGGGDDVWVTLEFKHQYGYKPYY